MKKETINQVKNMLRQMSSNEGLSLAEYLAYDKFTEDRQWAWENWDDDVTISHWGGEEKPEYPTSSFVEEYFDNLTDEEIEPIALAFLNIELPDEVQIEEALQNLLGDGFPPKTGDALSDWKEFCTENFQGFNYFDEDEQVELYEKCESVLKSLVI